MEAEVVADVAAFGPPHRKRSTRGKIDVVFVADNIDELAECRRSRHDGVVASANGVEGEGLSVVEEGASLAVALDLGIKPVRHAGDDVRFSAELDLSTVF